MTIALPAWLDALLPELSASARLSVSPTDKFRVEFPDGTAAEYSTLRAVGEARLGDYTIDESVYAHLGKNEGDFITYPVGNKLVGMLMSHTDETRRSVLVNDYERWLETAGAYHSNPTDFYASYNFVNYHPVFWTNHDLEKSPWYWSTDYHCEKLSQFLFRDKETGAVTVALETGSHVPGNWDTHFHDYRLDVYAPTFELAYVALAERVALFFNDDGSEVEPEPEHSVPEWVTTVLERKAEFDADYPEENEEKDSEQE